MDIDTHNLAVITLIALIGGFVFLIIEHIDGLEWRKSVERRLKRILHIVDPQEDDCDEQNNED